MMIGRRSGWSSEQTVSSTIPFRNFCFSQAWHVVGMDDPSTDSSGGKQRLGHISKQGNSLLSFLLMEAAQAAVRNTPDWRRRYIRLAIA
jgi:transposase